MNLQTFSLLALALFCIGLYGVLSRRNLIGILIGVELMLNAASLSFLGYSRFAVKNPATGQIAVLFIIGLAAAEAAVALSIVLTVYRSRKSINVDDLADLKG
ncbi:MAG: NADH-quinone oxidoreductase subunit NuoK [Deltaproteobacteria bacterium]|nr:NADH-quinone oxidoreductase subunit NuoK [Deltaproteobacteria bacterium]